MYIFFLSSLRVAETIHSGQEDWISVCRCMLRDKSRHYEIWEWLDHLPSDSLQTVVFTHAAELVMVDPMRLAILLANQMPKCLNNILKKLEGNPNLEYAMLGALYKMIQYKEEHVKMELSPDLFEKYLKLMCQLEPESVSISRY